MPNAALLILALLMSVCNPSVIKTAATLSAWHQPTLVYGLPNTVTWSDSPQDSPEIALHYRLATVRPVKLLIGRDHPNGVRVLVLFNKPYAVNLLDAASKAGDFSGGASAFDQFGDLNAGCFIQAAEWDCRRNGHPFIVIAFRNGTDQLSVTILKYLTPLREKDSLAPKSWKEVGSFEGNGAAYFDGSRVTIPNGNAGFGTEYEWVNGKFESTHLLPRDHINS